MVFYFIIIPFLSIKGFCCVVVGLLSSGDSLRAFGLLQNDEKKIQSNFLVKYPLDCTM